MTITSKLRSAYSWMFCRRHVRITELEELAEDEYRAMRTAFVPQETPRRVLAGSGHMRAAAMMFAKQQSKSHQ